MFAIVRTGGKQYKVQPQKVIMIEKLDLPEGGSVILDKVLMVSDGKTQSLGFPYVEGAFVKGVILDQTRCDKIIVFKKKRRHNYRRKQGHRQYQTVVRITEISGPNGMHFKSEASVASSFVKKQAPEKKPTAEEKITAKKPAPEKKAAKTAPPADSKVAPKVSTKKETKPTSSVKKPTSTAKKSTSTKTKES